MINLAIDLGTTTLAASLFDTVSGRRLAMAGSMNPQRCFGADVVSRLDAAVHDEAALRQMSTMIRAELLSLAEQLCRTAAVAWGDIRQAAIAGNPAMQHLLLGLPVKSLAFPPYRPLFVTGRSVKADTLSWDGDFEVYLFPMPGGFVGGDTVAFLYGMETVQGSEFNVQNLNHAPKTMNHKLFLDMGTNGEMALVAGETIWATSAAAGPAFEGGNLSCGMPALPGAISSVRIVDERIKLEVIGAVPAIGICGSAAIELVTELLQNGLLEPGGRLRSGSEIDSNLAARIVEHDGENAFVLYRDASRQLMLTQKDIRQIQLAKGAIRAGLEVLHHRSAIPAADLEEVVLTGSFGAVLKPEWLKKIGIFSGNMVQNSLFVREGALAGVESALARDDGFSSVEELAGRFHVVALSGTPLFERMFMQQIDFPADR